jgi:hypothetical protein
MASNDGDIQASAAGALKWDPADVAGSLDRVLAYVEAEAAKSLGWYWKSKRPKQWKSQAIRFFAIVLTASGGLYPLVGKEVGLEWDLAPALFVGLAATLMGVDKGFGYSSGWARYVLAATTIKKQLEEFRLDWVALRAEAGANPSPEHVERLLARASAFRSEIEREVLEETREWVAEFQANMSRLDRDAAEGVASVLSRAKAERETAAARVGLGALEVEVGVAGLTGARVQLEGNGGVEIEEDLADGAVSWTKTGLKPGIYRLILTGTVDGRQWRAERAAVVEAGAVRSVAALGSAD